MFSPPGVGMMPDVEFRIVIEGLSPPTGSVFTPGGVVKPFAGWLQLLGVLTAAVEPPEGSPKVGSGELAELEPRA